MSNLRQYRKIWTLGTSHYLSVPATEKDDSMENRRFEVTVLDSPLILYFNEIKPEDKISLEDSSNIITARKHTYNILLRVPAHIYKALEPFQDEHFKCELSYTDSPVRMHFKFTYFSSKEITEKFIEESSFEEKTILKKRKRNKLTHLKRKKLEAQTGKNEAYLNYLNDEGID